MLRMYNLRHVGVHVKPTRVWQEKVQVVYQHPDEPFEFDMDAVMLQSETLEAVLSLQEVKKFYVKQEMTAVLDWMLESQGAFGIGQVLRLGLERYCREVLLASHDASIY